MGFYQGYLGWGGSWIVHVLGIAVEEDVEATLRGRLRTFLLWKLRSYVPDLDIRFMLA